MSHLHTGEHADALRRDLGPTAWCALECLVERAAGTTTAAASVRSVAVQLGVAKNTAHRALVALVRAGVIEAVQERGADGRFRPGVYRLHLDDGISTRPSKRSRTRSTGGTPADPAQLTLLLPA